MAVSTNSIVTSQSLKTANAICTAAKTTLNDAANSVLLLAAQTNGAILYKLTALARATVTATKLQLYRSPDAGTTLYLIASATMAAYTMANTDSQTAVDFGYSETNPLRLSSSDALYVGASVALAGGIVFDATFEAL
jgi:hypothetical protein